MTGVLDEATETWTDLDGMLAAELPPCLGCDKPPVVVVIVKCLACSASVRAGLCEWHRHVARTAVARGKHPNCLACGTSGALRFVGLS